MARNYISDLVLFVYCRASLNGNVEIVEMLFNAGADGSVHNFRRNSALYAAVHNSHMDVIKCILEKCPIIIQVSR